MVGLGKTIIITGGNAGLGYETAKTIAAAGQGWHVLIAGRDPERIAAAVRRLGAETRGAQIEAMNLDLASLASVRRFAADVGARLTHGDLPPLQALVLNAGLQILSGTTYTEDGFETTFGVNHLGHFLLVNLLLPHLTAPARVVFVGSGTHYSELRDAWMARIFGVPAPRWRGAKASAWPERFPNPAEANDSAAVIGHRRYATSKLVVLFTAYELRRRLAAAEGGAPTAPITVNVFDPGLMPGSGLARTATTTQLFFWRHVLPAMRFVVPGVSSTKRSGRALARLILDPELAEVTGRYYVGKRERPSSKESYDEATATALWEASAALVGLPPADASRVGEAVRTAA